MKGISIRDVAREAGCSAAAVSSVLNGTGRIGDGMRERVKLAAARLGYVPNAAARSLRLQRTGNIGLLFYPTCAHLFKNVFYQEVMLALEAQLEAAGYNLLLASCAFQSGPADVPRFIRQGAVDGTILLGSRLPSRFVENVIAHTTSLLLLDNDSEAWPVDAVSSDGHGAEMALVDELVARGHRRMLMVVYDYESPNFDARLSGFLAGLRRHGLDTTGSVLRCSSPEDVPGRLLPLMAGPFRPTAISTGNDLIARVVCRALRDGGYGVPRDVSVVGFDDLPASAEHDPPLSSLSVDRKALGERGAELILSRIRNPEAPFRRVKVPTALVVRESIAEAAGA